MPTPIIQMIDDLEVGTFAVPFPFGNFPCNRPTPLTIITVTSLSVNHGILAGGYTVHVYGTNFSGPVIVWFGGIPATSVSIVNSGDISCVVPEGMDLGLVDVTVQCGFSGGTLYNGFTYTT